MADQPNEPTKRHKFTQALSNGPGTIITRLIVIAMPFMLTGSFYMGKYIVELWGEKVLTSLERIDKRLDAQSERIKESREFDRVIELRVQRSEDEISYLKDRRP